MSDKYYLKIVGVGAFGDVYYNICYKSRFLFFEKELKLNYQLLTKEEGERALNELNGPPRKEQ